MMNDDVFDQMAQHESHLGEFVRPVVASAAGAYIGHRLSKTRLGQWFEHSSVVGWIITLILLGLGVYVAYCLICAIWIFGAAILAV